MKRIAVVYWSGTGNTLAMADAVLEGVKAAGACGALIAAPEFDASMLPEFDAVAFGCPAMGAEVLEESEFAPMFDACLPLLGAKPIALFGSYGWGDGEWMRSWEQSCEAAGANLAGGSVICCEMPDAEGLAACRALGGSLAG